MNYLSTLFGSVCKNHSCTVLYLGLGVGSGPPECPISPKVGNLAVKLKYKQEKNGEKQFSEERCALASQRTNGHSISRVNKSSNQNTRGFTRSRFCFTKDLFKVSFT